MNEWHYTSIERPAEGQLVEVPNNGGTTLRYSSGLWFLPDDSMYVYYVPEYWKAV